MFNPFLHGIWPVAHFWLHWNWSKNENGLVSSCSLKSDIYTSNLVKAFNAQQSLEKGHKDWDSGCHGNSRGHKKAPKMHFLTTFFQKYESKNFLKIGKRWQSSTCLQTCRKNTHFCLTCEEKSRKRDIGMLFPAAALSTILDNLTF